MNVALAVGRFLIRFLCNAHSHRTPSPPARRPPRPAMATLTGNELAATLTSKFTAQAGLVNVLEYTVARDKQVPPELLALQTAKER
jgi:hypothetical protein